MPKRPRSEALLMDASADSENQKGKKDKGFKKVA